MEQKKKKPTNAQLTRRIETSPLHLDKTSTTKSVFFSDKGLRLTVDAKEGYALLATNFHTHVFQSYTLSGISRPYLYTERIVNMAEENDCKTEDGYSFTKLLETLKKKEDQSEYNIATYYSWYINNTFSPLYSIGESETESFFVYLDYIYNIAKNSILLAERDEDVTNKRFIDKLIANIREFTDSIQENVILRKMTDEELVRENIQAMQEEELNDSVNTNPDGK